ncbi:GntP family permease [Marinobacter sp. X15-166B]|uniref:GntP family permease n=1 Tax=Marinobacter sp. X15-166B TaxID=1897620 RepID=UPI00085CAB51|nr:GntP family permease [Marinobacter sp. X15-166B]OEY66988.1 gluconate transporter [Marinobacter sp. X15-166B]
MYMVIVLIAVIAFIVFATSKLRLNPFITLLLASFIAAFAFGLPINSIEATIRGGFGNILGYIGLVIVLGTIIGVILERTGAAIVMAETIIKFLGKRFPTVTMSIVGFMVAIPVFCDSGFVILNSLKRSVTRTLSVSPVAMTVALSTGLFATHTLVPPTPGPIAAAGNLGLEDNLGLVIAVGFGFALIAALAGLVWAYVSRELPSTELEFAEEAYQEGTEHYGELPRPWQAFAPIFIPIALICLGSVANYPTAPLGDGFVYELLNFLGKPLNALLIGLGFALLLIQDDDKLKAFARHTEKGLTVSAPIILITGAGGAFGAVLAATPLGEFLGQNLSTLGLGVLMPFVVAAALKSAQGSSTVALVTASALVAPLLPQLGLDSDLGRVLTVMAVGAGAMTVSHANDSYFWVVAQFSKMDVATAYRSHTAATLVMGLVTIAAVWLVSLAAL